MAITRRTAHFGLLATLAEGRLAELGYQVEPVVIDAALNRQCESVVRCWASAPVPRCRTLRIPRH